MKKLFWSTVPACITFGPSFMVSGASATHSNLVIAGTLMLAFGLVMMFGTICRQQKLIEQLWRERHPVDQR